MSTTTYIQEERDRYMKSLEIYRNMYGGDIHVFVATTYRNIAVLEKRIGNFQESRKLFEKSIKIFHEVRQRENAELKKN